MGKLAIIEKSLEESLTKKSGLSWHIGLLIGSVSSWRVYSTGVDDHHDDDHDYNNNNE